MAQGLMQCNDNTAAIMASYIVQAECGDYVAEDYPDHTYLSTYKFVPHQDVEMERKIMENHKKHSYVFIIFYLIKQSNEIKYVN